MTDQQRTDPSAATDLLASDLLARGMWSLFEPVHAITYFLPEARTAFELVGLRGFWRGYFAGRAAPLGRVDAPPVTALFFSFAPMMAARALPALWQICDPVGALNARATAAGAALRRLTGDDVPAAAITDLADRLWQVTTGIDSSGRALGAANLALPRPDDPYQALWQATSTLREHRGDGHVAALVAADVTGVEVLVLRAADGLARAVLQPARGWSDAEWDAATEALADRGLLTVPTDRPEDQVFDGGPARSAADLPRPVLTQAGRQLLAQVEALTDRLAARAWSRITAAGDLHRLAADLRAVTLACYRDLPKINPIGLEPPWDPIAAPSGLPRS